VEARGFDSRHAVCKSDGDNIVCDVRRILLVVTERADWIFRGRGPMRVSRRPDRRITHGREVEGENALLAELQIAKTSHLHDEIVRMLTVRNRNSESGFALLEQQWVS